MLKLRTDKRECFTVVRVIGELDCMNKGDLMSLYDRLCPETKNLVLDLRRCEYVDSEGIGCFFKILPKVKEKGGVFALISSSATNPHTHRILVKLLGINSRIPTFHDLRSAKAAIMEHS